MNDKPMEYLDDDGLHIMCACGHYMSGAVKMGDKRVMCPNCMFLTRFKTIDVVYPDRLPADIEVRVRRKIG